MSDRRSRARGYAVLVAVCVALELIILVWPQPKTADDGWTRRGWSGEIAGQTVLAQRFTVSFPNLRALRFHLRPYAGQATGTVRLVLEEVRREERRLVDTRELNAADVTADDGYEYRFTPIRYSTGRTYLLTIALPDASPGRGIAAEIVRRDFGQNPPNRLWFAGRERFGSLRFTADVDSPALLTRAIRYFDNGALGNATIVAVAIAWVGLHLLGARAVLAAGALSA